MYIYLYKYTFLFRNNFIYLYVYLYIYTYLTSSVGKGICNVRYIIRDLMVGDLPGARRRRPHDLRSQAIQVIHNSWHVVPIWGWHFDVPTLSMYMSLLLICFVMFGLATNRISFRSLVTTGDLKPDVVLMSHWSRQGTLNLICPLFPQHQIFQCHISFVRILGSMLFECSIWRQVELIPCTFPFCGLLTF